MGYNCPHSKFLFQLLKSHLINRSNVKALSTSSIGSVGVAFHVSRRKFSSQVSMALDSMPWIWRHFSGTDIPKGFGKFLKSRKDHKDSEGSEKSKQDKSEEEKKNEDDDENHDSSNDPNNRIKRLLDPGPLFFISISSYLIMEYLEKNNLSNEITFQEFITRYFMKGYVDRIQIVNKDYCRCYISPNTPTKSPKYITFRIGSADSVEQKLDDIQASMGLHPQNFIPIHYVNETYWYTEFKRIAPYAFLLLMIGSALRKFSVKSSVGMDRFLKMGKVHSSEIKDLKVTVKFKDVAGMHEAKREISEFVDFLKNPKMYEEYGAKIPKGALLCGAPGTGKTLLAKAVAGEAQVPFFSISGSDFIEVFVGIGPSRVRDLFEKARKNAPSIIFIDEIDAVGKKRAKGGFSVGGNDERENTLNQILVEMDGFKTSSGVVVLAGTNRLDILDPALIRPGRFDRTVNISKPDLDERFEIFKVHLEPLKLSKNLSIDTVARRMAALTPNFVGAEIANVSNEAAIQAVRRKSEDGVSMLDFDVALERVMAGLRKPPGFLSHAQKLAVAYHEVGHALAGWWLENADPVLKVSIVPRSSGALGFAQHLPDETMLYSREALLDKIAVILGGRAAEELFIGKITTGATDDLDKVTKMCYAFVSQFGMNPTLGLVSYQKNDQEADFYRNYSESTAQMIDAEVKSIIESQYKRVKELLGERSELVHKLSTMLYDKETITYQDIVSCVGERPFPVQEKYQVYLDVATGANLPNLDETTPPPQDPSISTAV
ncbi:bifunctional Peptidase [Babesia duncani]|uniref:Bifunctional Peptidase n=1 Tax=Babesia duncani TaxID=323732 RepID=A0AAD9PKS0_9APIC|nr:bifunctional Peptidase [Babesia duncani]